VDIHSWSHFHENIPRKSNLSKSDFTEQFGVTNKPVIITDIVPQWKAFNKWSQKYFADVSRQLYSRRIIFFIMNLVIINKKYE